MKILLKIILTILYSKLLSLVSINVIVHNSYENLLQRTKIVQWGPSK